MSAALDDPDVCDAMKSDIQAWFSAGEPFEGMACVHGAAKFLRDLAHRLRSVAAMHVDGGDVDELLRIASALRPPPASTKRWGEGQVTPHLIHQSKPCDSITGKRQSGLPWSYINGKILPMKPRGFWQKVGEILGVGCAR